MLRIITRSVSVSLLPTTGAASITIPKPPSLWSTPRCFLSSALTRTTQAAAAATATATATASMNVQTVTRTIPRAPPPSPPPSPTPTVFLRPPRPQREVSPPRPAPLPLPSSRTRTRSRSRSRTRSTTTDLPANLAGFVDKMSRALRHRKLVSAPPGAENDPVAQLFRSPDLPPFSAWKPYARSDASKPYTRNLVATDHSTYALLVLCWNPGQRSPVHDHPCDGCWLSVLDGELTEVLYRNTNTNTNSNVGNVGNPVGRNLLGTGMSSCISNATGLVHSVGNPSKTAQAVSLHLYAPPMVGCRCWDVDTDAAVGVGDDDDDDDESEDDGTFGRSA